VEKTYKRVENIDEKIKSVKLPYNVWKVLFLVDENVSPPEIINLLEKEPQVVEDALDRLTSEKLIELIQQEEETSEVKSEETDTEILEDAAEEPAEDTVAEVLEEIPEVPEEPEEPAQPEEPEAAEPQEELPDLLVEDEPVKLEDEIIEEPAEDKPAEEEDTAAEEIEEAAAKDIDIAEELDEQIDIEPEIEEQAEPETETISDSLDDLLTDDLETIEEDTDTEVTIPEEISDEDLEPIPEEEPAKAETPAAPAERKTGKRTVLIVDDSIVIRKMVEIALEDESLSLKTAVSGRDGLDKIDSIKPDLVILDLMLPDINGIDILKTIKASLKIPVIMLSGKDSPQMVENAKNAGADAFLPKPFKDEDLKEKINSLLEG